MYVAMLSLWELRIYMGNQIKCINVKRCGCVQGWELLAAQHQWHLAKRRHCFNNRLRHNICQMQS